MRWAESPRPIGSALRCRLRQSFFPPFAAASFSAAAFFALPLAIRSSRAKSTCSDAGASVYAVQLEAELLEHRRAHRVGLEHAVRVVDAGVRLLQPAEFLIGADVELALLGEFFLRQRADVARTVDGAQDSDLVLGHARRDLHVVRPDDQDIVQRKGDGVGHR
jgi:hypothetical protein